MAANDRGRDGRDGRPGRDGKDGADGQAGLDAYEVAVSLGFAGDRAEWLRALRGEAGAAGKDGLAGRDGRDGKDGVDGQPGPPGRDGVDGRGLDGLPGIDGKAGARGRDGSDGWSPLLAVVADGERRVLKVVGWAGGDGEEPESGFYIGPDGPVRDIGEATDLRGAPGRSGGGGGRGPRGDKGDKGDPGAPGGGGASPTESFLSATALGSSRVVYERSDQRIAYADFGDPATAETIVGVTLQAANAADVSVLVQSDGTVEDLGWSWTPEQPVFLAAAGLLTQDPSGASFIFQVGAAVTPTLIRVRLEDHPTYVQ